MTTPRWGRWADAAGRFLYVLAWPLGLYYALVFGGSVTACFREGADPFGWAMSGLMVAMVLAAPVTLLVVLIALVVAIRMRPAPGSWRRRYAWLGAGFVLVLLLGLLTASGDGSCHLDMM